MRNFVKYVLPQHQSRSPQLLAPIAEQGLEREIENNRAVVVSGDGAEIFSSSDQQTEVEKFSKEKPPLSRRNSLKKPSIHPGDASDDSDDAASWVRTPVWPKLSSSRTSRTEKENKDEAEVDYFEHANTDDIPELDLSRSGASTPATHPARPPLHSFLSSSSGRLAMSPLSSNQESPGPRRTHSTSSLAARLGFNAKPPHDSPSHTPSSSSTSTQPIGHHSTVTSNPSRNPSSTLSTDSQKAHTRSRSTTFLTPLSLSPNHQAPQPLLSPSIRRSRQTSGLTMPRRKKSMKFFGQEPAEPDILDSEKVPAEVESLVEEYTRLGPANQTVVVSAAPSP